MPRFCFDRARIHLHFKILDLNVNWKYKGSSVLPDQTV
jgi:hypothetical protein